MDGATQKRSYLLRKMRSFFPNAHFVGEVLKKCGEVKTRFLRNSFPVLLSDSRKNHQVQNSTLAYSTRVPAHSSRGSFSMAKELEEQTVYSNQAYFSSIDKFIAKKHTIINYDCLPNYFKTRF